MRIAVIGSIGSGKSEVIKILKELNMSVLSADETNREILRDSGYLSELSKTFPKCFEDGELDKTALRSLICENETERMKLNAIAHPRIMQILFEASKDGNWFIEVPLLDAKYVDCFDGLWLVRTSYGEKLKRIAFRDGVSKEEAKRIIKVQSEYRNIDSRATKVIENNKDIEDLRRQVKQGLKELGLL